MESESTLPYPWPQQRDEYEAGVKPTQALDQMPDDPCVWMIVYSDAGIAPETFSGCGATIAAHMRFEQVKVSYNVGLFVRVAHA